MTSFNKKLKDYLTVYKVPLAPNSLDPALFYFPDASNEPKLLPAVESHLMADLQLFAGAQPTRIKHCLIVGDAVTPGKSKNKPVKVLICLNKNFLDHDVDGLCAEQILKTANSLSERYIVGTTRSVNYVPMVRDLDTTEYDGIYDVLLQRWMKLPRNI